MKVYSLTFQQNIQATGAAVWQYFSSPRNLSDITPPDMGFRVTSTLDDHEMYAGMIISYIISPFPGFTTTWVTEITHVDPGNYFVDEQRSGPFALWHHQHRFRETPAGVHMTDILHYAIPLGIIGRMVNTLIVEKRLNEIFAYRKRKIAEIFPS